MHKPPTTERMEILNFLDASGRDIGGLGRCDTDNNVTFRCPDCNYALTTCGDCFIGEEDLSEKFYDAHFVLKGKKGGIPDVRRGDCPKCRQTKKSNGGLVKVNDNKIPSKKQWEVILQEKGLDNHGRKDGTI